MSTPLRNVFLAATAAWLAVACDQRSVAQSDDGFIPLFDGTLAGWTIENTDAGNISVSGGILRVEAPRGWLRSEQRYGDFSLRLEFRFVTDDADSGIFVRAVADAQFGPGWPSNSYQVQLRNPVGESPFPPVGGIFRHGRPAGDTDFDASRAEQASTGTGEWQTLEIDVSGERLTVDLNGVRLTDATGIVNPTGYIGLQAETGAVEFRAIEINAR
jgi:hypothetical protein